MVKLIRISLQDDGTVAYFGWDDQKQDYNSEALKHPEALDLMRNGVPVEVACSAGEDKWSNFESPEPQVLVKI